MKKSYLSLMLTACLALGITSCEDRLDIPKHGNMGSKEPFYQTDEEAEPALAALHISFRAAITIGSSSKTCLLTTFGAAEDRAETTHKWRNSTNIPSEPTTTWCRVCMSISTISSIMPT